jgi:lysophospholipid acyltransferase (LPLAT)-like uncharacterized protein
MDQKVPLDLVSGSIWLIGSALGRTWRFAVEGTNKIDPFRDRDKGVIYAFWHSHILPLSYIFRGIGTTAVVSGSKDGDRATAVAQRWNHETIRGSSTRGQIGVLRQCRRALENKKNIVIIPDGPRGPKEIVKPGVAVIAMSAKAPVYPVRAFPKKMWRLRSWDGFMIPKPFTFITVRIEEPILPGEYSLDDNGIKAFSERLGKALTE